MRTPWCVASILLFRDRRRGVDPRWKAVAFFETWFGLSTVRRDYLAGLPADEGMIGVRVWLSGMMPQSDYGDPDFTVHMILR